MLTKPAVQLLLHLDGSTCSQGSRHQVRGHQEATRAPGDEGMQVGGHVARGLLAGALVPTRQQPPSKHSSCLCKISWNKS